MLIIGIILAFVGSRISLLAAVRVGSQCTSVLRWHSSAGLAAYHSGSGPIGAIVVGAGRWRRHAPAGQVAFANGRAQPIVRAAVRTALCGAGSASGLSRRTRPCIRRVPRRGMARCNAVVGAIIRWR